MSLTFESTLVYETYVQQAILGARLSYGSGERSDTQWGEDEDGSGCLIIGPEDEKLVRKLVLAGGGEDKLLRTIPVSVFITAPLKWWVELDTYKVGTVRQSSSLMHRLQTRGYFTSDDFDVRDPSDEDFLKVLMLLNGKLEAWIAAGGRRNDKLSPEWTDWQDLIPRSYRYKSQWVANYAVLRNVYSKRKNHRMALWQDFCGWVEGLPHSWMITMEKER